MNLLNKIVITGLVVLTPILSSAQNPMPMMDAAYNQAPQMMPDQNMQQQMMMQRQHMMRMQQQNRPQNNAPQMNHNPAMCDHSPKQKKMKMKMKKKMKAAKMEHMKKMETRLANIEALLKQLVDLQKSK